MGRKKRSKPFEQGSLKEIYKMLIVPFVRMKPEGIHLNDWLDRLFCVDERSIDRYKVNKDLKIPGHFWAAPKKLVPGVANRAVKAGTHIWVRIDTTMPDRIDVEVFNAPHGGSNVFAMTRREYDTVKIYLSPAPLKTHGRIVHSWEKK